MPWSKSSEEQIPDFNLPGEWSISDASLKQLTTSPPGYLTESELISLVPFSFFKIHFFISFIITIVNLA